MNSCHSRVVVVALVMSVFLCPVAAQAAEPAEEETHSHAEALKVTTGDEVLKEQIEKVTQALEGIHEQMAQRRRQIQGETDEAKKAALYAELDGLRKEHDMLERLLHDLVEEATATEWTAIDEALRRAKAVEQYQERLYQKEEVIRDRQK